MRIGCTDCVVVTFMVYFSSNVCFTYRKVFLRQVASRTLAHVVLPRVRYAVRSRGLFSFFYHVSNPVAMVGVARAMSQAVSSQLHVVPLSWFSFSLRDHSSVCWLLNAMYRPPTDVARTQFSLKIISVEQRMTTSELLPESTRCRNF